MADDGLIGNVLYSQVNAESIPFEDNTFDCITIAFGLRNVTDKQKALESMTGVLQPGGRLMVLEFSKPTNPGFEKVYDRYSFSVLPMLGKLVTNDSESYRYLAESIRMHPDQQALRQIILEQGGFDEVEVHNLSGGIVALHRAFKY